MSTDSLEQLIRYYIFIKGLPLNEAVKKAKSEYEKKKSK